MQQLPRFLHDNPQGRGQLCEQDRDHSRIRELQTRVLQMAVQSSQRPHPVFGEPGLYSGMGKYSPWNKIIINHSWEFFALLKNELKEVYFE